MESQIRNCSPPQVNRPAEKQRTTKVTEYIIVISKFHITKPAHEDLAETVQQKLIEGYQPVGRPFVGGESMYQAMVRVG